MKFFKYGFSFIAILSFIGITLLLSEDLLDKRNKREESVTLTPTPTRSATLSPSIHLKKTSYIIALFGDSMIDTMGEKLEYLEKILRNKYLATEFKLYNYGIGSQNIEQGLARFESSFTNKTRQYPPLPAIAPDIIVLGSFAYNPFESHDRNKHYILLIELVVKAKKVTPNVYILAEIAPLKSGFGKGKNGINWPEDQVFTHTLRIIEQLDNAVILSKSQNIPLINAYYASRIDGIFGDPYYVNTDDGIHPSAAGHSFMAELIARGVKFDY